MRLDATKGRFHCRRGPTITSQPMAPREAKPITSRAITKIGTRMPCSNADTEEISLKGLNNSILRQILVVIVDFLFEKGSATDEILRHNFGRREQNSRRKGPRKREAFKF